MRAIFPLSADSDAKLNEFTEKVGGAEVVKSHFVCVQVSALNKGLPVANTMLSLPTRQDVDKLHVDLVDLYGKGLSDCVGPTEAVRDDPTRKTRFVVASTSIFRCVYARKKLKS